MAFDRQQQVGKLAEHVGPDCLEFKGTSQPEGVTGSQAVPVAAIETSTLICEADAVGVTVIEGEEAPAAEAFEARAELMAVASPESVGLATPR